MLQAIVDQARQQSEFTVPLIGGGTGTNGQRCRATSRSRHREHVMAARVQRGDAVRRGKRRPKERRPNATSQPTPEFAPDSFPWRVGELIVGVPRRHAADKAEKAERLLKESAADDGGASP